MADLNLRVKVAVEGANQLRNLGSDLQSTGKGLTVGVTAPLVAAGAAFVGMAADAQKSQAKLASVFDSTGAAAWTSIEALNAHAEALMASTTFDDDAVAEAQASLLRFGNIAGEQFTGATEAAADLAAFMETDISDAAEQLGKALADPEAGISRLTRAGIIMSESQQQMVRDFAAAGDTAAAQQVILDALSGSIGNVAEDLANTDSGKWAQTMNSLGEAAEAAGVFLLPLVTTLASGLKLIADGFSALPGPAQGMVVALAGVAAAVGPVLWIGGKLIANFQAIGHAFSALKLLLLANPFVALAAAVVALVALVVLNWDKIVAVFKGALSFIAETGKALWTPISTGFTAAIDVIRGAWNAFAGWWNSLSIGVPAFDVPFVGTVGGFNISLPKLPMLAEGGIVTQPTLALIGERGPEAVVPLNQYRGGGGNHFEFHVTGEVDEERVVSIVGRAERLQEGLSWG
jgi:hypothetical protein